MGGFGSVDELPDEKRELKYSGFTSKSGWAKVLIEYEPLVSVILPVYNGEQFVGVALESAMQQTYQNLEILVVDDGSTDGSLAVVKKCARRDPRVRVIRQANGGVARARNHALAEAKGEYIAPLDADDLWLPDKIERQVRRIQESGPKTGFVYCWWAWIDEKGDVLDRSPRWTVEGNNFEGLLTINFTGNASVPLFRRSCLEAIGGYNPALADAKAGGCEDWEVVLRIANTWSMAVVNEILLGYRRRRGSMSSSHRTMWHSKEMVFAGMRELRPDLPEAMFVGANHQFAMYLAGLAYWSGDILGAIRWALQGGKKLPIAVAPYVLKMMLFRRRLGKQNQRMEPGKSINPRLVPEPLLPYDRIRNLIDARYVLRRLYEIPTGLLMETAQLTVRQGILIWLWCEARANERIKSNRPRRVLANACWHFPVYSHTFVYRELLGMMEAGFDVRFAYSGANSRSNLPDDLGKIWGVRRKFFSASALGLRDMRYYTLRMPDKVNALAKQIAAASGLTESEVRGHRHFWFAFTFARMAQAWKAEYIHTYFFYEQALYGLVAATLLDLPRGLSCYADHMMADYELKMVGMHLKTSDVIVATSERIKRELEAIAGGPLPKALVKPNGIDSRRYGRLQRPANGQHTFRMVAVNRIHPKKGITFLVEAARELRERGYRFSIDLLGEFDVFDNGTENYFEDLKTYVATHGLEDEVRFRGRQTAAEVREYLAAADVFLAPFIELANGDKDGIPTALLEGMAAGCAVVCTDAGSMLEVVRNEVEALVVPQCDAMALADAIQRLMNDDSLRARLGKAAVDRVNREFDVRVCEPRLHDRIRTALVRERPDPYRFKQTEPLACGKLRIGLLSYEYPPETGFGGIGTYTYYLSRALARAGHQVVVLAGAQSERSMDSREHDGVVVHRYRPMDAVMAVAMVFGQLKCYWIRSRLENLWSMYWGLRQLMQHYELDIVEMPECGAEGALINWLMNVPTVVRLHGPSKLVMDFYNPTQLDRIWCPLMEQVGVNNATFVTSCSEYLAEEARLEMSVSRVIRTIPNGIDLRLFDAEPAGDLQALYGIPKGTLTILFAGRMERRKGIELCGRICELVLAQHKVTFLFAGDDSMGYVEATMLPELAEKNLLGSVRYLGKLQLKELRAVSKAVDIYLLPSLWENMPYACLEAMAAGRALVASRQGGMPELVTDETDGLLAELGSPESFAQKVVRLIEDESLRTRIGKAARAKIEREFTDDLMAQRAVETYEGCIRVSRGLDWKGHGMH